MHICPEAGEVGPAVNGTPRARPEKGGLGGSATVGFRGGGVLMVSGANSKANVLWRLDCTIPALRFREGQQKHMPPKIMALQGPPLKAKLQSVPYWQKGEKSPAAYTVHVEPARPSHHLLVNSPNSFSVYHRPFFFLFFPPPPPARLGVLSLQASPLLCTP